MSKSINKKVRTTSSSRTNNKKNMNKDLIFPMIVGVLLGAMIMIFWQFNARLNNVRAALVQLDTVTSQNTATTNEVVNFLNQSANPDQKDQKTQE